MKIPLLPGSKPVFCRTKLGEKVKGVERGRKALLFDGVPVIQRSPCGHLLYNGRCRPSMWQRWGVEGSSWLAGTETKTVLVGFLACFWQRASERPGPCLQQAAVCLGAGPMCPSFGLLKQCRARLWGALEGESKLLLLALLAYLEKLGLLCLGKPRSVLLLLQLAVHFSQGRDFLEAELVDTALGPAEPRGDCFQCLMQLLPLNCRACTFHSEGSFLLWQGLPGGLRCLLCWWGLSSLPQPSPAQPSLAQASLAPQSGCGGLGAFRRMEKSVGLASTFTFSQVPLGTSLLLSPASFILWQLSLTASPALWLFQSGRSILPPPEHRIQQPA